MYYLFRDLDGSVDIYKSDKSFYEIQTLFKGRVIIQFGRKDYAIHWAEYYNGEISEEEHKTWLNQDNTPLY